MVCNLLLHVTRLFRTLVNACIIFAVRVFAVYTEGQRLTEIHGHATQNQKSKEIKLASVELNSHETSLQVRASVPLLQALKVIVLKYRSFHHTTPAINIYNILPAGG